MSTITIRASSWAGLFDCAMRWEGQHLLGINKPAGTRALLGTAIHKSTAVFDQARIDQSGVTADDAAGELVEQLHHPEYDVDTTSDDLTIREAERIGLSLHTKYCLDVSPQYTFRSVEMPTDPFDIECGDVTVRLTGTMDRSRVKSSMEGNLVGIADLKSGGTAVQKGRAKTKGHAAQLGTYEMLFEHTTGERISDDGEIIGLKTKGKPEIASGTIKNAKQVMLGTENERGLIEYAAEMFRTGLFPPNPNSVICGEKYCARWKDCIFRDR